MTDFKNKILPIAKKYKFAYFINDMDDDEIIEFIAEEVFLTKDFKSMTFEQAKAKCENLRSLDSMIDKDDQEKLYEILQRYE